MAVACGIRGAGAPRLRLATVSAGVHGAVRGVGVQPLAWGLAPPAPPRKLVHQRRGARRMVECLDRRHRHEGGA